MCRVAAQRHQPEVFETCTRIGVRLRCPNGEQQRVRLRVVCHAAHVSSRCWELVCGVQLTGVQRDGAHTRWAEQHLVGGERTQAPYILTLDAVEELVLFEHEVGNTRRRAYVHSLGFRETS